MAESVQTVHVPVMARRRPQGTVINWAGRILFALAGLLLVYVLARDMLADPGLFGAQVVNGLLLPIVLTSIVRLAGNQAILGKHANGRIYGGLGWVTVVAVSVLSAVMVTITVLGWFGVNLGG